jgi:hypothetical protein
MSVNITDEMVAVAMHTWYPDEWPDAPIFAKIQPNGQTFGDYTKAEMRGLIETVAPLIVEQAVREERERFAKIVNDIAQAFENGLGMQNDHKL